MNWFHKIFRPSNRQTDAVRLLNLRCTRFRQLVRNYGKILDAIADAAEKQGGDYILDRQYVVTLSEVVIDKTEAVVFDLNILAGQRYGSLYHLLDRFRSEIRDIITMGHGTVAAASTGSAEGAEPRTGTSATGVNRLAEAVGESEVLYQRKGRVACGGVAAGPVFNLETEGNPDAFPKGAVMVAADFVSNDELIRLMRRASAILTDLGEPATDTTTLTREFGIPTIVGLEDASGRLDTGTEITVDADENIVYLGRNKELLERYESERLEHEEETEYRILRRLRRMMFPLTLDGGAGPGAEIDDCRTLHDLVHLAHELAGETQFELISDLRCFEMASAEPAAGLEIPFYVIDVVGGLARADSEVGGPDLSEIRSLPLRMFVRGVRRGTRSFRPSMLPPSVLATVTEEHANIMVQRSGGFDLVDSMIGESKDSNHIYCRFASTVHGKEGDALRGAAACEVLKRLDFAAARTARAASAWLSGVPRVDMEEYLTIIGCLSACLWETDSTGWGGTSTDEYVDTFIAQHV